MLLQRLNTGLTGKAFKLILMGVLFAAVAGLVMMDAGGFFRNGGVSRMDVARAGDRKIGLNEFAAIYRRALQQSKIDEDKARQMGLPYMVLQQEMGRDIMLQTADHMGIRVTDAQVARQLMNQLEQTKLPGTNHEKLNIVLQQQGISETQLVNLMRGDMAISLLSGATSGGDLTVPSSLAAGVSQAQNEKRVVEMVAISPAMAEAKPVTPQELQDFYKQYQDKYRTAEVRDLAYLILPKNIYSPNVTITDADVQGYYNEHAKEFLNPPRVHMEQIIAKDEATANKIAKATGTLESQKSATAQYIPMDWYAANALPKELSGVIFTDVKTTGIVGPVQTGMGWNVMKIDSYEDAKPIAFDEVKDKIKRQLQDEKLDAAMNDFSNHIDSLISSGSSLNDVAKEYKVQTKTITGITAGNAEDKLKDASASDAVTGRLKESVFTLGDNETSPLIDTPEGDYLLVQITHVTPSVVPPLDKIKDQVMDNATQVKQLKALGDFVNKIVGTYDHTKPQAYFDMLKAKGLTTHTMPAMTKDEILKTIDKETANLAFTLTPENDLSYTASKDKATLIRLVSVKREGGTPDNATIEIQKKDLQPKMAQELQQQFMGAWEKKLGTAVNRQLVDAQFINKKSQDDDQTN
jgi:peptidyl-prolyl cis-trans isomerase D